MKIISRWRRSIEQIETVYSWRIVSRCICGRNFPFPLTSSGRFEGREIWNEKNVRQRGGEGTNVVILIDNEILSRDLRMFSGFFAPPLIRFKGIWRASKCHSLRNLIKGLGSVTCRAFGVNNYYRCSTLTKYCSRMVEQVVQDSPFSFPFPIYSLRAKYPTIDFKLC